MSSLSQEQIAKRLHEGAVALIPTDTVYGLAASPLCDWAIEHIFRLKGRPRDRNLPVMVGNLEQIEQLGVELNNCAKCLLESKFVPGPLTIVVGFADAARPPWLAGREEVALRIPNDDFVRGILQTGGPLLVTSANVHGAKTPESVFEILAQLDGQPDIVVDRGKLSAIPSSLVNCRKNPPVVERVGVVSIDEIARLVS